MKVLRAIIVATTTLTLTPSCRNAGQDEIKALCGPPNGRHVCSVPFETIFSHREALIDHFVALEGVLVVGVRGEPPGSKVPVALLFSSADRATTCNPGFAVEIKNSSGKWPEELKNANGYFVTVAGQLKRSPAGHWLELEYSRPPVWVNGVRGNYSCMAPPPPMPPDPEATKGDNGDKNSTPARAPKR
jgi:hypothetical protein